MPNILSPVPLPSPPPGPVHTHTPLKDLQNSGYGFQYDEVEFYKIQYFPKFSTYGKCELELCLPLRVMPKSPIKSKALGSQRSLGSFPNQSITLAESC